MAASWERTDREWGNGRSLRGNAHLMERGVALCGYRPHERTRMRPVEAERLEFDPHNPRAVQACPKCLRRQALA